MKQLLVKPTRDESTLREFFMLTTPAKLCSASNEQEVNVQIVGGIYLNHPVCTTNISYDKEVYRYKIFELIETSSDLDDYAEYSFVVRECHGYSGNPRRQHSTLTSNPKACATILRKVLHYINAVRLVEEKPSVILEKCAVSINGASDYKLVDGISAYLLTTLSTREPRHVVFHVGEETTRDDVTFFKLECLFLNYDGAKFGEAGVFLHIAEFRGLNPIVALSKSTIRVRTTSERACRERSDFGIWRVLMFSTITVARFL
ncbi:hypothetical protein N7460_010455 [Penicillium canescens]|uniref:Uncharacterized protein n=1 Tax=Penicillium canescens TaxID=5083 RepID=A0AAD6N4N3_PENCN|nr:hypothetical protein N7460_010455 [Penicillium canescens]KAJ6060566.1 hypothetical protein N7444_002420 [Penicillium canescens]KAJ6154580.1 hypothetical protein N7485_012949 [Penicillium canescens]